VGILVKGIIMKKGVLRKKRGFQSNHHQKKKGLSARPPAKRAVMRRTHMGGRGNANHRL